MAPLDEEARAALRQAVALLSRRGYATEELRSRLRRKHTPSASDAAIAALEASGFLDDRSWASAFVAGARGRERSSALLRQELRRKGVADHDTNEALRAHDDYAAASSAAARRIRSLRHLDEATRARRLRDYLLRRGFSSSVTLRVLRDAEADTHDDD